VRTPELFDAGLQPERTRLAWRRTLLALVVAALVAGRTLPPTAGSLVGVAGLGACAVLALLIRRRADRTDRALLGRVGLPGGGLLAGLAAVVTVLGAAAVVALAVR
jgi:putative membrane protein